MDNCPKDFFLWRLLEIPGNMSMTKFNLSKILSLWLSLY